MESLKDKKIAVLLMVIMITLGTVFGSHRSLMKLYNSAEDVFYYGENGDGFSIQHDLEHRIEYSGYLVKIAKNYLPADSSFIADVENARNALDTADTIKEKSEADYQLNSVLFALYNELENHELSKKDVEYRRSYYSSFISSGDKISSSSYNDTVRKFNSVLNNFPANVLGRLTAIHELDTF
jgi:LemA protein